MGRNEAIHSKQQRRGLNRICARTGFPVYSSTDDNDSRTRRSADSSTDDNDSRTRRLILVSTFLTSDVFSLIYLQRSFFLESWRKTCVEWKRNERCFFKVKEKL